MTQIIYNGQLNIPALTADGLYIQIIQPPGYISGVPTDVFGIVGGASWGPVNRAVHMGSPLDGQNAFGSLSAASLTDPHDLATDIALAFGQAASQAVIEGWAVRVTDGTDTKSTVNIVSGSASASETATLSGSLTIGDVLHLTATSGGILGSPVTVTHTITNTDSFASCATALAAAINGNSALTTAGISASAAGVVVTIVWNSTLSVTWSESVTGSATEVITLASGAGSTTGLTLTALYSGVLGNQIVVNVAAGAQANSATVVIAGPNGTNEIYPNISFTGFWTSLLNAINNGLSNVRGPSGLVVASNANSGAGNPTFQSYNMSGGTDGRSGIATSNLLGVDGFPGTGLYALRQLSPPVGVVWICGLTDPTAWADALQFEQSEGCTFLAALPLGTSTASALSTVATNGIHDPGFAYCKDWVYWYDPVNAIVRLSAPNPVIGGEAASLAPQTSPGNKTVSLVLGTERINPWTGGQPYTVSEVGQLESSGVMFVTKPIPAGNVFGIRHGQTTSLSPVTAPFEWWRMTSYLARSFGAVMGVFVGQNQSQQPNDPLRAAVSNQLNSFLQLLKSPAAGAGDGLGQIDDYNVVCTFSASQNPGLGINTPQSIAQHYLFAMARVRYLSSVRFFILSLQGGTTVVTVGASTGQNLVSPLPPGQS
jgi:uncharacterized protein